MNRKFRDDAVVMRPMILQLDPKWFAEHNPDWRENGLNAEAAKYINAQLDWAAGEFGQENFPGLSVHLDETNPQVQLLFTCGAVQRIEKRTEERTALAVEQVAGEASAVVSANLDAANDRAEKIITATSQLQTHQLWSAAAAMCLTLLPVATVLAALSIGVWWLVTGVSWALSGDGDGWFGVLRWLAVAAGLGGGLFGLFRCTKWVAALVGTWKTSGTPTWPHWKK